MFGRPIRLISAAIATTAAIAIPVITATPASAETFGQYQQACFNSGGTRTSDPANPAFTIPAVSLVEGDTGACVEFLQEALDTRGWGFNGGNGYGLAVDGSFGPLTHAAVVSFQKGMGLDPDGEVGPLTWTQLGPSRD